MKIENAIITGPTGAVGVALINELIKQGTEVAAICRKGSSRISNIPFSSRVHVIECDMDDYDQLETNEFLTSHKWDVFYHFAWKGPYGKDRNDFILQEENIKGTIDAVRIASKCGCRMFVGAGSQSEYGSVEGVISPKTECCPTTGYGVAKYCAGVMSRVLCGQMSINHIWCRIISLYGPYEGNYTMLMGSLEKMLRGEKTEYTKGDQIWDYIYSKDAATAFRMVGESDLTNKIYCFASGKHQKLREYIIKMRDCVNPKLLVEFGTIPYYSHQTMNLNVDVSDLKNDLGFECQYSFEDGINDIIKELREGKKWKEKDLSTR